MTKELKRISFDEFSNNLAHFFKQVINEHEPVVVTILERTLELTQPYEDSLYPNRPAADPPHPRPQRHGEEQKRAVKRP
jgi:hypothetical protein